MRHEEQLKLGTATTLDEPVSETIMRDLREVASKLKVCVIYVCVNVCLQLKFIMVIWLFLY